MGVNGIYGLSGSGLDIESLVKVGMMSKQNEYDKMAQKYTKNEWTKAAYVELNNQINTFNMTKLFDYKLTSTMKAKTATSSDETAVTATANGNAVAMPHRVDVDSLSTNAYLISNNTLSSIITGTNGNASTENRYLQDILFKSGATSSPQVKVDYETQSYTSGTTTIDYSPSNGALTDLKITRNNAGAIEKLEYQKVGGNLKEKSISNIATEETTTFTFESYKATLKANTSTTNGNTTYTFTVNDSTTYTGGTKDTDGNITFASKTNTDGSTSTRTLVADTDNKSLTITDTTKFTGGTVETTSPPDTTTYKFGDTSITITQSTDGSGNTTYTVNGGGIDNETVTGSSTSGAFTFTTTDGKTLTFNAGTGTNDASFTIEEVTNYSNGSTFSEKVETVTADNVTATITTNTDESGSITTSANTVATESGFIGSSVYNNSADNEAFLAGRSSSIITDGNKKAIEFSIGDGKNQDAVIGITFDEIYKGTWNETKKEYEKFSINDLVSRINNAAKANDLNVRATYESLSDRFFLYNSESGSDDKIEITIGNSDITDDNAGNVNVVGNTGNLAKDFFNNLGLAQTKDGGLGTNMTVDNNGKISVAGEDGTARVDGVQYTFQDNKLNIEALGVTYTFNKTTTTNPFDSSGNLSASKVDNPVTVTVGQDTDAIVSKVKSFVEDYNKILGSLYEKYDEKADSNYKPLTQSQKDSMKEEQITKWEEKAKQGLLYHDSTLSKIISDMRSSISGTVELDDGTKVSIFNLGISTTGIKGQLTLDEDKLKKALSEDPDIVYNVFGTLNTNTGKTGSEYQGVAQRLGDIFTDATKAIKNRAGSSADIAEDSDLNNLLRELQTKMSNFKKLMSSFEDRLYKKYDAMEAALTKLGTQLSFITGGQ